ncbi:MAG: Hpt domain-containing protein [Planctomycetaceae bacterium]|jgi:HPt (histidine-containing phosphotransfer) domain-containing protein|nr:Hpt domain-containing protein [Planctomycetaceae bacterium]
MKPADSLLIEDDDLRAIVMMFVDEMPERAARFRLLLDSDDLTELMRFSHQFKGSAGSYGFAEISQTAADIEAAVKDNKPIDQIKQLTEKIIKQCNSFSKNE